MPAIEVRGLKKHFGSVRAVDGISFNVRKGEIMGFLGPNGAGKSTTINCMLDLLRPDKGGIRILDLNVNKNSVGVKKRLGYLSEEANFYSNWTGQEHIDFIKGVRGDGFSENNLIQKLDFNPEKKVKDLSSGNRQKLGLILALMHEPEIIVLDEPTRGLDPILQQTIYKTLKDEATKGSTVFMSSHNLAEVEQVCDRVCIIKAGKVVNIESISELKEKRIYQVQVYFEDDKTPELKQFDFKGVEVKEKLDGGYIFSIKKKIKPLLKKLLEYDLKNIEVTRANLEEIFLEYYK